MQLWNWRGLDVINAHERDPDIYIDGIRQAIAAVAEGALDPSLLYNPPLQAESARQALDDTRDRPDGFLKGLVTFP